MTGAKPTRTPYVICLVSSISSGSSGTGVLLKKLGAHCLHASDIALQVMQKDAPAYQPIIDQYGENVLSPEGKLYLKPFHAMAKTDPLALVPLHAILTPFYKQAAAFFSRKLEKDIVVIETDKYLAEGVFPLADALWFGPELAAADRQALEPSPAAAAITNRTILSASSSTGELWRQISAAWQAIPGTRKDMPAALPETAQPEQKSPKPQEPPAEPQAAPKPPRRRSINWPLVSGSFFILIVAWLAVQGPDLAPADPLEEHVIIQAGEKWYTPPFPVGIPGFLLGSDDLGRDLLSRILWGIRPTFQMVMIVAAVRLVVGTLIGLIAGWSRKWPGRVLDTSISAALAIPVIMVALGGIAAVGVELGIWAFVIGLSLTGWVETARIVRERTTAIRGQVYIEASNSLGASNLQIVFRHVFRQIVSMLWMLLAFEISSTLMLTAALGFLGYYIGGDVWVQVTDATARAVSGTPELGQMLATTGARVTEPWGLLAIGGVVFLAVLGFNLLGEGLRQRASMTVSRRQSLAAETAARIGLWIEDRILWPLGNLTRGRGFQVAALVILAVLAGTWGWGQWQETRAGGSSAAVAFDTPIWGQPRGDAGGTRWSETSGPETGDLIWTYEDPEGFAGAPVIGQDGVIYAAGLSSTLYALAPDGSVVWQAPLPAMPAAGPALDRSGNIYITDMEGGLSAFSPAGELRWRANTNLGRPATAGPTIGPEGTIYYPAGTFVQSVLPSGYLRWETNTGSQSGGLSPVLALDDAVILEHVVLSPSDGEILSWLPQNDVDQYIAGADGKLYYRKGNDIYPRESGAAGEFQNAAISWDFRGFTTGRPQVAGITPDGNIWLFYSSFSRSRGFGEDTRLIWLNQQGEVFNNAHYATRNSSPVAIDTNKTLFTCGNLDQGYGPMDCQAFDFGAEQPRWTLGVPGFEMAGGALAPDRLYVTTTDGYLHAIGKADVAIIPTATRSTGQDTGTGQAESTPESTEVPSFPTPVPLEASSALLFTDQSGFTGAPVILDENHVLIAGIEGQLYALTPDGGIIWQVTLPARPVGSPAVFDDHIYMADRKGLTAFTASGETAWRFEHDLGTSVGGVAAGPEGNLYYTIDITSKGHIQAVSPAGEGRWVTQVQTFGYYRMPQVSPNGQLIFFRGEVYLARDGSLVDLQLDFEPDEVIAGADGNNYLLLEETLVRWSYAGSRAVLADERIISTIQPSWVGVTEDGIGWVGNRTGMQWFRPTGEAVGEVDADGFFSHVIAVGRDLVTVMCGRDRRDFRQAAKPYCIGISPSQETLVWEVLLNEEREEFTGGFSLDNTIYVATEEGNLYRITLSAAANSQ